MVFNKLIEVRFLLVWFCVAIVTPADVCGQGFTTVKTGKGIEILENGKKVLLYQERPKSLDGKYERTGYVHPLYSLNGKVLTEDFPEDHPYHHGIFWAWHQILLNDKKIADGWICENISWQPVKLIIAKKKPFVMLQSEMLWKSRLNSDKSIAIIKENTKIIVHKSSRQYRTIDFDISLFALVDTLKIGGSDDAKGYGGFCLRLKLPRDISFFSGTKEVVPEDTAVTAGAWIYFSGSFDGITRPKNGIAVFCKPSNPGFQQQWILRKELSMQNVPYPGRSPVIVPRKGLRLRYRIIISKSTMSNDDIEKLFQQYIRKT